MGGELAGPGGEGLGHDVQGVSGGRSLLVYKCTAYKGGPGTCPRFGRLG